MTHELSMSVSPVTFFFNATASTLIYTLSLHDALPISTRPSDATRRLARLRVQRHATAPRSEEHTSELQSLTNLVCRLLLEKKNTELRDTSQPDTRGVTTPDE